MKLFYSCIIAVALFFSCKTDEDPVSAQNGTYQTDYGVITRIDGYPLYRCSYSADYKFDVYLETGQIPYYSNVSAEEKNYGCTCFSAFGSENRLLGRNYDWPEQSTYFIVFTEPLNGYTSVSTVDLYFFEYNHSESPEFSGNQNILRSLPYYPFDGMNEKGVAVGMNALPEGRGPFDANKVTIGELQVIRLVLDYAASTREAISLIRQYNVRMEAPPIHYLIADSSGHSAIIEFVDGQMHVIENEIPWQVTTNFIITDWDNPIEAPCWRYQSACSTLGSTSGILSENGAWSLLEGTSVTSTRWSALFNLKTGQLQVAMGRAYHNPHLFSVFE